MPILSILIPFFKNSLNTSVGNKHLIVSISLLIKTPTLFRDYLKHQKLLIPGCFLIGLLLLAFRPGTLEHPYHHFYGEDIHHIVFAALAGISLVLAHEIECRFCRILTACNEEESALNIQWLN